MRCLTCFRDVEWLLVLDDLWSSYLSLSNERAGDIKPDFEGLCRLAAEMDDVLARAPEITMQVGASLEPFDDEAVGQALALLREVEPSTEPVVDWLFDDDADATPRARLLAACEWVRQETEEERAILRDKAGRLEHHELPDPDLRPVFRCMWALVGIGAGVAIGAAGIVSVVGIPATVGLGVVAYGYGVSTTWKKSGCKETAHGIAQAVTGQQARPAA